MLSLELILSPGADPEAKQYRVLQGLKECYDRFSRNRLYPDLADLIHLAESLQSILDTHADLRTHMPQNIVDLDVENQHVILQPQDPDLPELSAIIEFVQWALLQIHRAIQEGMTIYGFVDEHIAIEEVGIMPMYNQEGYWLVPDLRTETLHLLRYELSLFSSVHERYRTLKTVLLESLERRAVENTPESVKLRLLEKYSDMPNPATYSCAVDIDFPYVETILPVAKRKLLSRLVA